MKGKQLIFRLIGSLTKFANTKKVLFRVIISIIVILLLIFISLSLFNKYKWDIQETLANILAKVCKNKIIPPRDTDYEPYMYKEIKRLGWEKAPNDTNILSEKPLNIIPQYYDLRTNQFKPYKVDHNRFIKDVFDQECNTFNKPLFENAPLKCEVDDVDLRRAFENYYNGNLERAYNDLTTFIQKYPNNYKGYVARALLTMEMSSIFSGYKRTSETVLNKTSKNGLIYEDVKISYYSQGAELVMSDLYSALSILSKIGKYKIHESEDFNLEFEPITSEIIDLYDSEKQFIFANIQRLHIDLAKHYVAENYFGKLWLRASFDNNIMNPPPSPEDLLVDLAVLAGEPIPRKINMPEYIKTYILAKIRYYMYSKKPILSTSYLPDILPIPNYEFEYFHKKELNKLQLEHILLNLNQDFYRIGVDTDYIYKRYKDKSIITKTIREKNKIQEILLSNKDSYSFIGEILPYIEKDIKNQYEGFPNKWQKNHKFLQRNYDSREDLLVLLNPYFAPYYELSRSNRFPRNFFAEIIDLAGYNLTSLTQENVASYYSSKESTQPLRPVEFSINRKSIDGSKILRFTYPANIVIKPSIKALYPSATVRRIGNLMELKVSAREFYMPLTCTNENFKQAAFEDFGEGLLTYLPCLNIEKNSTLQKFVKKEITYPDKDEYIEISGNKILLSTKTEKEFTIDVKRLYAYLKSNPQKKIYLTFSPRFRYQQDILRLMKSYKTEKLEISNNGGPIQPKTEAQKELLNDIRYPISVSNNSLKELELEKRAIKSGLSKYEKFLYDDVDLLASKYEQLINGHYTFHYSNDDKYVKYVQIKVNLKDKPTKTQQVLPRQTYKDLLKDSGNLLKIKNKNTKTNTSKIKEAR